MHDALALYMPVAVAFLALGIVYLVQAVIADVAGIRAGHVPGAPIGGGHDDFLFRATRAQANTNESFGLFVVLAVSAVALAASPRWTNALVWIFVVARVGHMLAYYTDLRLVRSGFFTVGFAALIGLAIIATLALA